MNASIIPGTGKSETHEGKSKCVCFFELSEQEMDSITSLRNDAKAKEFFYYKMPAENDD